MAEAGAARVLLAAAGVAPERLADLARGADAVRVLYLGADAKHRRERERGLARSLPHAQFLAAGELVNAAAARIRDDFIQLDAHIRAPERDPFWQYSDTAERNPYSSALFFNCCAALAALDAARTGPGLLLLLVEDPGLAGPLEGILRSRGLDCAAEGLPRKSVLARALGDLRGALRERAGFVRQFLATRRLLRSVPGRRLPARGERPDALLVTWATRRSFGPGPKDTDIYFGELPGRLRAQGLRVAYLCMPLSWVESEAEIIAALAQSPETTFLPEDCLGLGDILGLAVRSLFWRPRLDSPVLLGGADLSPLVERSLAGDRMGRRLPWAARMRCVGRWLARRGVVPTAVFFPFENQPWEKALRQGLREHLPAARLCGFQHVPFSRLYLSYYPSRRELRANLLPDLLFVTGPAWREIFTAHGWDARRVRLAPALRLDYLHAVAGRTGGTAAGGAEIVVAGAMDFLEMYEALACKIFPAARFEPRARVVVKFHPRMSRELVDALRRVLREEAGAEGGAYVVSGEDMGVLVRRVAAVAYQSSGVGYEALCAGAEPIFLSSETALDVDPMDWFPEAGSRARSPEELGARIVAACAGGPEDRERRRAVARRVLARAFLPVNEANLAGLLDAAAGREEVA